MRRTPSWGQRSWRGTGLSGTIRGAIEEATIAAKVSIDFSSREVPVSRAVIVQVGDVSPLLASADVALALAVQLHTANRAGPSGSGGCDARLTDRIG